MEYEVKQEQAKRSGLRGAWTRRVVALAIAIAAAVLVAACGSSSSSSSSSATVAATSTPASTGPVAAAGVNGKVKEGTGCGDTVAVGPKNPTGVYASMSDQLKNIYSSYPNDLYASPWATKKITAKPPWKIGYIAFAITNQYNDDVLKGLKKEFAAAKAQGLVTGDLVTNIPATSAQSTPEGQISAIQQMVSQGVNAIILLPVDSVSETPAMEAAGKAGVPVILADTPPAPGSKYAVSAWSQNQVEADAGALGLIGKGNILMVKGIAGNENDVVLYNQAIADLKNCPNIHVAATLYGQWDNGTAKSVVSQYLASHPQPIAGAIQDGGMFAGVVQAFQAKGLSAPTVSDGECYGGDLSWWLDRISTYKTVAGCFNGFQGASTYFNVALRVLANKGPKYNVLEMPAVTIDNSNLAQYAQKGLPLTSSSEIGGPDTAWCDNACLDKYFMTAGAASKS
jgi:ribose transport system substrate-binding protein